jgi:hypothetical protein
MPMQLSPGHYVSQKEKTLMKPFASCSSLRCVTAGFLLVLLSTAAVMMITRTSASHLSKTQADALVFPKGDVDEMKTGRSAEAAIGANETRLPDYTPDVQAYLTRAYPANDISLDQTIGAQSGWASLNAGAHSAGAWQLVGPSKATQPGVLNVLEDGAQSVVSGRVTAMAKGPSCAPGYCPVYVGAAGGGIWRTRDGLAGHPQWEFVSGSFATNAIGSLIVDPNDSTGNTLYAGTGEPNVSVDSEAGMGIYKSTDGGTTWTLLPGSVAAGSNFQGRAVSSLAIAPDGSILAGIARAVRGVSSTDGGATSNPPASTGPATFGVYKSTDGGATFTNVSGTEGSVRGVNEVTVDPNNGTVYYASFLGAGVWRSSDAGATWTQIKNPLNQPNNSNNTDRSQFALANNRGTTRIYVGIGASGGPASRFFRADNAQTATDGSFTDMTTAQNIGYCDPQCWYDNVAYSPAGYPSVVYLIGSFSYGQLGGVSNGRAVLLSTDGGATFTDMSQDAQPNHATGTHPDQHAIVTNPNNPFQYWEGSDGGVVRSDGSFGNVAYKCSSRGLSPSGLALCQSLLSRVPNQLSKVNDGLSTLQFQSFSVSAQRPQNNVQGGTQDNGTWQYSGSSVVWYQEIYGDGGQSGFSSSSDALRFNTFTGQANDGNFRNGDPTKWVILSGPIINSPEGSYFYPPVISDPNPARGGTIFQGSFSVWRTQDWGGSQAFLEANCPEFTTSAANPSCGDFVPIGPSGQTDLTSANYGATRQGGAVSAIARAAGNTGTLWVSTGAGRVFISDNADGAAGSVTYTRLDNKVTNSPGRFPASIAVDASNPHHAWIAYSGYNSNTPLQPGHVFDVTYNANTNTVTWTDLSNNLPNLPVNSVAHDDVTGDLYASSDFGVMGLASGSSTWTVAGSGLPMVEVPGLTINSGARLLYASTHGRSAWVLQLP